MPVGQAFSGSVPFTPVPGTLAHAGLSMPASLLPLQGLLKKHEAFETDFTVHKDRVNDVCTNGQDLVKKVSLARGKALVPMPDTHLLVPHHPSSLFPGRITKGFHETISSPIPVFCKAGEDFH